MQAMYKNHKAQRALKKPIHDVPAAPFSSIWMATPVLRGLLRRRMAIIHSMK
jgi:hypothetical protein